jgi:hypothetical protein
MSTSATLRAATVLSALAMLSLGCEEPAGAPAAASASASSAAPAAAPPPTATASATAEAPKPSHPCPEGSEGKGTQKEPCVASGAARILEVTWMKKITDKGPKFRVKSKAKVPILYGDVLIYFYDAAGKQLEVEVGGKTKKRVQCAGNIFAGAVKPGEGFALFFSCASKKIIPEGATAIEAELRTAGFPDASGNRSDTFWRNDDLTPDERPKGGVK